MPDYKVKITPELDSGKFQKEIKNLTKDRTMKIKIDTSGLEKAAKLIENLSKTPVNWNFHKGESIQCGEIRVLK